MDDRNAQVGWTDAQWNRVRQAITEEWRRVRVAGSVLPMYGPLPPSTQVVPSEVLNASGDVDDGATARLLELAATVELSRQQVSEDELTDAILQFRRAATAVARAEDKVIFNGQQPATAYGTAVALASAVAPGRFPPVTATQGDPLLDATPSSTGLATARTQFDNDLQGVVGSLLTSGLTPTTAAGASLAALLSSNPGALGLVLNASRTVAGTTTGDRRRPSRAIPGVELSGHKLVSGIVDAVAQLNGAGYGAPFVAFLSRNPFVTAHEPSGSSMVLPADRIEPLIGRTLIYAPALDEGLMPSAPADPYAGRAVIISLAGDAVDLAVAVEATAEFTQVTSRGKYDFRVLERFALRIKDPNAIVRIEFQT